MDLRPLPHGAISSSQVRNLKYSVSSEGSSTSGCTAGSGGGGDNLQGLAEHTDRGLLTLIVQPSTEVAAAGAAAASGGGLEVFDQRSEEWVKPPVGAMVVMVGHTLEKASTGVFRATRHRVISGTEEETSFAFQIRGRPEASVSVGDTDIPRGIRRLQATEPTTVGEH
jgi:isopenicillin N synthase-like dioxygenase